MTHLHNRTTEESFAERVLNRIADEHLVPRSHWEFVVQNYLFWGLGVIAVLFGAFAFSAMLFEIENVDWRLALVTHGSFLSFFLDSAPVLWILALALFLLIGYANVRRTRHGYRYSLSIIALGAVLTSLVFGTALYAEGIGSALDEAAGNALSFHTSVLQSEHGWWTQPTKGLLSGSVVSMDSSGSFTVRDFSGAEWNIEGDDLRTPDLMAAERGGVVRIVGVPTSATSSSFHACFVLSWEQHGLFHRDPLPVPFTLGTFDAERNSSAERSDICRGIRPYTQLKTMEMSDF